MRSGVRSPIVNVGGIHYLRRRMSEGHPQFHELFESVKDNDADRVFRLIDSDPALLDITDARVSSPLLVAFAYGYLDLAERLIERGANVFTMNHSDMWAMKVIVRKKDALKAADRKRLLEKAIAVSAEWATEIFHAVWRRDRKAAETILKESPSQASVRLADPNGGKGFYNTLPYCGLTPLHYAVLAGDKRMVQLLLKSGAEVDAVPHGYESDSYHTPMFMVPGGCREIAEMLIEHGANPRHSTTYLSDGSRAMRKVVIAHGAAGTPLMTALYLRDFDRAIEIARDNPDVIHDRLPGSGSGTPLHLAARVGCLEVIDLLIAHGMDIDTIVDDGDTALAMASEMYCSFDVFKTLTEHGADVRVDDDKPLFYAIWQHAFGHWNYERVIRFLVEKGCVPRGLHFCAIAGNLQATKLLIELGADVNDRRDDDWPGTGGGFTPLDYCTGVAGEQAHPQVAEFLRQNGAEHASDMTSVADQKTSPYRSPNSG